MSYSNIASNPKMPYAQQDQIKQEKYRLSLNLRLTHTQPEVLTKSIFDVISSGF